MIPSSNPQALHEERDRDHPIPGYCSARTPAEHQAMGAAKACRCQHPCRVKMTGFRCERRWRTSPSSLCCRFGLPRFHAACCTRQRLGLPARSRAPSRLQRKQLDSLLVFPQEGGVSTGRKGVVSAPRVLKGCEMSPVVKSIRPQNSRLVFQAAGKPSRLI